MTILQHIGLDVVELILAECLTDARYVDVVTDLEAVRLTLQVERDHTPVHAVTSVTLGCILLRDVCEGTEYTLAGSGLLTGRAVARLVRVDGGTDLDLGRLHVLLARDLVDQLEHLFYLCRVLPSLTCILEITYRLRTRYVLRITSRKRELCEAERVRTIGRGLTGRDELIGRSDRIEDLRRNLEKDVVGHHLLLRPVLDVRSEAKRQLEICLAPALVYAVLVCLVIVVVLRDIAPAVEFLGRGQLTAVGCGRGDGTSVHEAYGRHLAYARLRALTVREVTGRMADGKCVVRRCVACAEARAAESGTDDGTRIHEVCEQSLAVEVGIDRLRGRVDAEIEFAVADVLILQCMGRLDDIGIITACTAGDDALLHLETVICGDLVEEGEVGSALGDLLRFLLGRAEDVLKVIIELADLVGVGRMERKGDHRADAGKIDLDAAVIVCDVCRIQLLKLSASVMLAEERLRGRIGSPDGGQAGGLRRHDINTVPVIRGHAGYARAHELHYLILDIAVLEDRALDRECNIVWADEWLWLAGEVDGHHARISDVIGLLEELLAELSAALTDRHGTEGTVAGVGIGAEDHLAAAGEVLTHELMTYGDVRWNIDSAVLLCCRKTEVVVVIIDRTTDCTE